VGGENGAEREDPRGRVMGGGGGGGRVFCRNKARLFKTEWGKGPSGGRGVLGEGGGVYLPLRGDEVVGAGEKGRVWEEQIFGVQGEPFPCQKGEKGGGGGMMVWPRTSGVEGLGEPYLSSCHWDRGSCFLWKEK